MAGIETDSESSDDESRSGDDSRELGKNSTLEDCPTQEEYNQFKEQWNKEHERRKAVTARLEIEKRKRSATKKVTHIKKLPSNMRLPMAQEAMMLHALRETLFCNVKIVDSSILSDGVIVKRVMHQVGVQTEEDKKNYRRHVELAVSKKIGEFRNNSIRKLRKTFMGSRNDLTGKLWEVCGSDFNLVKLTFHCVVLTLSNNYCTCVL